MKLVSTNPGKGFEIIGEVETSTDEEIKQKVEKAKQAQKQWNEIGLEERLDYLKKVSEEILKRKEDLAKLATEEMGMPITQTRFDIEDGLRYFNWYLDNAGKYLSPEVVYADDNIINKVFYEPIGVAAVISPWNYPLSNFVWGCGQNLIVGNTVVFKHSEECPLLGKLLEEIMTSILPEGVFSEVYGDGTVGDLLVHQDINLISFTGSSRTGKQLYKIAAEKFIKIVLEMGGSAPGIIFEDANIEGVLETIYSSRFSNCGQMCDALKRLIVHESKYDETVEKLKTYISSKKVGDPLDESTDIGPLVAKRQLELLEEQVKDAVDKGAEIVIGGERPENLDGAYYEPTILTKITKDMRVWQEEIFGPVLPVMPFKTEEEAIQLANDTKYGLGAYVYTQSKDRALKVASQINTGMVSINNTSYIHPCSPFGGNKESGLGREHGKFGFAELTNVKVISMEK